MLLMHWGAAVQSLPDLDQRSLMLARGSIARAAGLAFTPQRLAAGARFIRPQSRRGQERHLCAMSAEEQAAQAAARSVVSAITKLNVGSKPVADEHRSYHYIVRHQIIVWC